MKIVDSVDSGMRCFLGEEDGNTICRADYSLSTDDKCVITHVGVAPAYRGRGVGEEFVGGIVGYARDNSIKLVPVCPFAVHVFREHPEYEDVL